MYVTLGWMLLAGLLPSSPGSTIPDPQSSAAASVGAPARVVVWADREDPYRRGDDARVYLRAEQPAHVAVFRVDTDGRIRVLFPREPWGDTWVREARELEVTGGRDGRSFVVDDDPGIGYLFAVASARPLDFDDIARGDHWDYRAIDGGRISGDPYVALADLAARIAPEGAYDYDINPYYVERRYEYPRFVCYDCHAYAKYDDWDPYGRACARFRVVIYDDPRYYPYRAGRGRNVVIQRATRPEPRYVFRDADPERDYVTRVRPQRAGEYRQRQAAGRTSQEFGGRGSVPVPGFTAGRQGQGKIAPPIRVAPPPPPADESAQRESRRRRPAADSPATAAGASEPRERRPEPAVRREPESKADPRPEPQSTGEPELRRRKP